MHFAARTDFGDTDTAFSSALREARQRPEFIDLTASNPTRCGFAMHEALLLPPLGDPGVLRYDADPIGMRSAREAISRLFEERYRAEVSPDHVLLTASTSEAYSHLLRLFCEPGDAILVPSPSYPLFDLLARLHDAELLSYPLVYHDGWQIDPASLAAAVTPRTRAIVAIHPNNPTGHYCSAADFDVLFRTAREYDLPLIVDEVFLDYTVHSVEQPSVASFSPPVLTFAMGGLSKLLAMPGMKLAWTAVCGPDDAVQAAMQRLEVIADTFLSVATPPQVALPAWLGVRGDIQQPILERVLQNLATLDRLLAGSVMSRLRVDGGWSVVLRVPAVEDDEDLAVRLLRERLLAVHPGSLYGFPGRGWLVISLLPSPEVFADGVAALLAAL